MRNVCRAKRALAKKDEKLLDDGTVPNRHQAALAVVSEAPGRTVTTRVPAKKEKASALDERCVAKVPEEPVVEVSDLCCMRSQNKKCRNSERFGVGTRQRNRPLMRTAATIGYQTKKGELGSLSSRPMMPDEQLRESNL